MACSRAVFIVAAKRTPFGTFGGKLKDTTATTMGYMASVAALEAGKVDPSIVDSVVFGNVIQSSTDAAYIARHVGLRANIPIETPALTVNRLCGSSFQSIVSGAQDILLGDASVALVGGSESMSQAPYAVRGTRFGTKLGSEPRMEDTLWAGLTDEHIKLPMAITAENLAEMYGVTRLDCDEFAIQSQQRWANAQEKGHFKEEIAPVTLKTRKGDQIFDVDEHPKPATTLEGLSKLPPVFKKNGTVTAGNASGISDGACALILASEEACAKHNLTPLARLVSYGIAGVDPSIMGIGPAPAVRKALKAANLELKDMALVEVNEAFAPQFLGVARELSLDMEITNVSGGAIALGHPLAASGGRITGHLVHELRRRGEKYAIGSACIGGGQGIAVVLENIQ
ncbi:3-ketoacyl-CoA thiolase, mitochondrial-like [Rhopilema esculentum]|uniref:3-ketoacyl-CoA thiolase, mitochondrial-like n=1 Tax=Rhopilema esculentum TaxID=499914 RepID=UPI0031DCFAF7|eukprot:gene12773-3506_t